MNAIAQPLFIQVGRRRYQVDGLQQASEMYCAARDASGKGASKTPDGKIVTANGTLVARVSYNGRVWPPEAYRADQQPLYDNR